MNQQSNKKKEGAGGCNKATDKASTLLDGSLPATTVTSNTAHHNNKEDSLAGIVARAKVSESKHFASRLPASRQPKKYNKDREEKVPGPEEVEEEQVDSASLIALSAAPPTDAIYFGARHGEGDEHVRSTHVRPGAVRVPGIGQQQSSQQALFDSRENEAEEQQEDSGNDAKIPGDVVAVVLDDDQLDNEYHRRHGVVEAEKVVSVDAATRKRRMITLAVAVLIATAAVITGVLVSKSKQSSLWSLTNIESSTAPTSAPVQRMDAFRFVLLNHSVSSSNDLSNFRSDQFQSLNWLANIDAFQLDVSASSETIIERYILALVYFVTNGPAWSDQLNFLSNNSICQWNDGFGNGIVCNTTITVSLGSNNEAGQHATLSLSLVNNHLTGTIPTEFGRLSRLTRFVLTNNTLTGTIPTEIGDLSNLGSLGLVDNPLRGTIPAELWRLSSLTSLSLGILGNNGLNGTIPTELGELSSLVYLDFHTTQLTGTIPTELGRLSRLAFLNLFGDLLDGTIPTELGQLSSLTSLYLGLNQLFDTIPTEIGRLSSLAHFDLSGNKLIRGTIPTELGGLSRLTALYLYNNQLTGTIPTDFGRLSSLTSLDFSSNELNGTIPTEVGRLSSLILLSLSSNELNGTIPTEVGQLSRLTSLYLGYNELNGTIPTEVGRLSRLTSLYLGYNQLYGTIRSEIGRLTGLNYLDLCNNTLTGTVPTALAALSNLDQLYLNVNDFTGNLTAIFCTTWSGYQSDYESGNVECSCCTMCY